MKKLTALILALMMLGSVFCAADQSDSRTVIGSDLGSSEIDAVYKTFGIARGSVKELTVTNADERAYLEGLVDEKLIGSRAISCVYINALDEGDGLKVSVKNISWCTPDMYMNAMITAGITDADVVIAAPFEVSGTAALTGIFKAYEDITGKSLDGIAKLVGTQELTVTAGLADAIGSVNSTAIVNELKLLLDETAKMSDEELRSEISSIASEYGVTLNDSQIDRLIELCRAMEKLNVSELREKIENAKQKIINFAKAKAEIKQFFESLGDTVSKIVDAVIDFFTGIFGK